MINFARPTATIPNPTLLVVVMRPIHKSYSVYLCDRHAYVHRRRGTSWRPWPTASLIVQSIGWLFRVKMVVRVVLQAAPWRYTAIKAPPGLVWHTRPHHLSPYGTSGALHEKGHVRTQSRRRERGETWGRNDEERACARKPYPAKTNPVKFPRL